MFTNPTTNSTFEQLTERVDAAWDEYLAAKKDTPEEQEKLSAYAEAFHALTKFLKNPPENAFAAFDTLEV